MASSTQRAKFDLKTICDVLGSVEHKWFKMGIQLGISRSKLQEFKKDEDPFSAVIEYWLRGNVINSDCPVSWETIVAALKSRYLDEPGLAEEVSMTYCQLEESNFTKPKARDGQREDKEPEKVTAARSSSQPSSSDCPEGTMDPGVRTELERILERNVKEIIAKYATYVDCLRIAIIEKEVSADDLRSFLLSLSATSKSFKGQKPSLLSDKSSKLENCSTVTAIFNILITECTSFLNYDIYGFILNRYGICDDREEFKYSEHLQDYITKHKISEFAKVNPLLKPGNGSKDLIVKFDIETTCSLAKLTDLKKLIADIMEINSLALEIVDIEEGCVIVTFFIPASLADVLFTPHTVFSSEQEEKLRAAAVMWFKCNGHTFHFGKSKVNDTALEKLKKQLMCSICLGTYTDPKQLQCQHAYCQQCLMGLVQQDQQGQPTLTCPTCRQVTPVPASGVAGLQADFRANQLLDIVSSALGVELPVATSNEEIKPQEAAVIGLPADTSHKNLKPKVSSDTDPTSHTLSPEYRTLVSVVDKLITEISANPVTVASKLASKGLIPPLASPSSALLSMKEKEVMAGELMMLVENEVKRSRESFQVFLSVLSQFTWLQGLAGWIRGEFIQMARSDLEDSEQKDQNTDKEGGWHTETIVLEKSEEKDKLGITIGGRKDGNSGIFIVELVDGALAERDGRLQLGDQIVSVNGESLLHVTFAEAVKILKHGGQTIEFVVVQHRKSKRELTPAVPGRGRMDRRDYAKQTESPVSETLTLHTNITLEKTQEAGGVGNEHLEGDDGIFVTKIISGGAAEKEGTLAVGDRILQVNGCSMVCVTHAEAVSILMSVQETAHLKVEKSAVSSTLNIADKEAMPPDILQRTVVFNRPEGTALGFSIIGGVGGVGTFIRHIHPGSLADRSNQLVAGDKIIKINEQYVADCFHEEAVEALKNAKSNVTLVVEYRPTEFEELLKKWERLEELQTSSATSYVGVTVKQLYVRAMFDFDATTAEDCPPSRGLSFKQRDILHVLDGRDEEWWEAALVGRNGEDGPQGVIPSKRRVEQRNKAIQKDIKSDTALPEKDRKLRNFKLFQKLPFTKKVAKENKPKAEEDCTPTYQPVVLKSCRYTKPVIIFGPLRDKVYHSLQEEFPDKFTECVPHTSRAPREGEVDGRDYHFVPSVEQMKEYIQDEFFIEAGYYHDNFYGTSLKVVQEVASQNKHCLVGVISRYAIHRLQMVDLHPIVICLRPTSIDVVKAAQPKNSDDTNKQVFEKGRRIEHELAELITAVVEGDSLSEIYENVKNAIHEQSGDSIWVPSNEPFFRDALKKYDLLV